MFKKIFLTRHPHLTSSFNHRVQKGDSLSIQNVNHFRVESISFLPENKTFENFSGLKGGLFDLKFIEENVHFEDKSSKFERFSSLYTFNKPGIFYFEISHLNHQHNLESNLNCKICVEVEVF